MEYAASKTAKTKTASQAAVLIVDDDPDIRSILKDLLTDPKLPFTLNMVEASNGVDALRKLSNQKFALMITDLRMPKMSGGGLLQEVTKMEVDQRPESILVLSAVPDELGYLPLPDVKFVEKPVSPETLIELVKKSFEPKSPKEMISKHGFHYLAGFSEAAQYILSSVYGITLTMKTIPPQSILDTPSIQSLLYFMGSNKVGFVRLVFDQKMAKNLPMAALKVKPKSEPPKDAQNANADGTLVFKSLVERVYEVGKALIEKNGISARGSLPECSTTDLSIPKNLQLEKPATVYFSGPHGAMQLDLMIAPIQGAPSNS